MLSWGKRFLCINKVLSKKRFKFNNEEENSSHLLASKALSAYYFDIDWKITSLKIVLKNMSVRRSKSELINRIKVYLAGSRAMRLIYNESYTNSQDDF